MHGYKYELFDERSCDVTKEIVTTGNEFSLKYVKLMEGDSKSATALWRHNEKGKSKRDPRLRVSPIS